jgi:hypothetical protein
MKGSSQQATRLHVLAHAATLQVLGNRGSVSVDFAFCSVSTYRISTTPDCLS